MERVTSADGTPIAWYDLGGTGPDLLLAHATGFCGEIWLPVVEHLKSTFRCVTYDLRGHGHSDSPTGGQMAWDWQRYADDACAVIQAANLQRPFGVGHSCGGTTELLVEERLPGTFRRLYLFEPVLFTNEPPLGPDPDRDLAVRTRKRRTTFTSRDEAIAAYSSRGPFASLDSTTLAAYVEYGFKTLDDDTLQLRCKPEDEAEVYIMASAHDGFSKLSDIRCATTIAHGANSNAFSEEHMRIIAKRIPNGTFVQWNELGHFGPLEKPKQFALVLRETLR